MSPCVQAGLFGTVKCCVIGAQCTQTHIASVAIHPGYEERARNVDLYVDRYLVHEPGAAPVGARPVDENVACIRNYPVGSRHRLQYYWTIFKETATVRLVCCVPHLSALSLQV